MPELNSSSDPETTDDENILGIDRKRLRELRQQFLHVNQLRLDRTRASLHHRQSLILDLLPLLFHVNHPLLPGYVSQTAPAGLSSYKPDKPLLREARRLARGFRYQSLGARQQAIWGLYVMGSVGTIGQSRSSDLDIWVCHASDLKSNAIGELQNKCQRISQWCEQFSLEVCFFPMDGERFRRGETVPLSEESSGSSQHGLLLDEFYRSAIYLGGRYPLWWFVPVDEESNYDTYTAELLQKRFLRSTEVLDLGMPRVPPNEFITAAIWQLYKGIQSPYKSVLKLLLLESYAASFPHTQLLSSQFKARVQAGCEDINRLDPYLLTYESIEQHLLKSKSQRRLEVARRCLYFKIDKPLTRQPRTSPPSWQRIELRGLVGNWNWDEAHIRHLDQRRQWKTAEVARERQQLVNELLQSYRQLSGFVHDSRAQTQAIQQEITILGRKLYAAFERKAGKIDWINPDISPDLSETWLTLQQCRLNQGRMNQGSRSPDKQWLLLDQPPPVPGEESTANQLRAGFSPLELLVWAYCNGILADHTHSWLQTGDSPVYKLNSLHKALRSWLPLPLAMAEHKAFRHKPRAESLMLVLNLRQPSRQDARSHALELDPLNVGRDNDSLINDAHLIVHNSWNEVFVQSFEKQGLETLLTEYLRHAPPRVADRRPPRITVFCREGNLAMQLQQRLKQLVQDMEEVFHGSASNSSPRFVLCNNGHYSCWQIRDGGPECHQLGDEERLLRFLAQPQPQLSLISLDRHSLSQHPLAALTRLPASRAIQVGYRVLGDQAELLVLDERGSLFQCHMSFHSEAALLRPLHHFLRNVIERQQLQTDTSFVGVYPVEFYRLVRDRQRNRYDAGQRPVNKDISDLPFFNLQVIVEVDCFDQLHYAIYSDEHEFHEADHGPRLLREVAAHILSQRSSGERYPCYLTDLDLSLCSEHITGGHALQSCHYLQIKHDIERRLNHELQLL